MHIIYLRSDYRKYPLFDFFRITFYNGTVAAIPAIELLRGLKCKKIMCRSASGPIFYVVLLAERHLLRYFSYPSPHPAHRDSSFLFPPDFFIYEILI